MPYCVVITCKRVYSLKSKEGVIFHHFPKDEKLAKKWLLKCKIRDFVITPTCRVCSDHFMDNDYKHAIGGVKLLLPTAVPSLLLPPGKVDAIQKGMKNGSFLRKAFYRDVKDDQDKTQNGLLGLSDGKTLKATAVPSLLPTPAAEDAIQKGMDVASSGEKRDGDILESAANKIGLFSIKKSPEEQKGDESTDGETQNGPLGLSFGKTLKATCVPSLLPTPAAEDAIQKGMDVASSGAERDGDILESAANKIEGLFSIKKSPEEQKGEESIDGETSENELCNSPSKLLQEKKELMKKITSLENTLNNVRKVNVEARCLLMLRNRRIIKLEAENTQLKNKVAELLRRNF